MSTICARAQRSRSPDNWRAGGERIRIVDPNLGALPDELAALPNVSFCDTLEAVRYADIVVCWWSIPGSGKSRGKN
jgi:hypothetical protein